MTAPSKASLQEHEYEFPYHYVPSEENGFRQLVYVRSSYEYQSYLGFVLKQLEELPWTKLLDVGCGDGRLVYELGRAFEGRRSVGIDLSERAIKHANAMNPRGHYLVGDVTNPALFDAPFDVVTLVEVLEHVPPDDVPRFLAGIRQRLAPSGFLLLTVPSQLQPLIPKHYQHFSIETLTSALQPDFEILRHHYINRKSVAVRVIEKAIFNPLFIFRERYTLTGLMSLYRRYCLHASARDGRRIVALCRPR